MAAGQDVPAEEPAAGRVPVTLTREISFINANGRMDAADFAFTVRALRIQFFRDFLPAWEAYLPVKRPMEVVGYDSAKDLAAGSFAPIEIVGSMGEPGVLGDHGGLEASDSAWGRSLPDSTVMSHEMTELAGDPFGNRWVRLPSGLVVALEVCLAGDTEVLLSDGTSATIEALAARGFADVGVIGCDGDGISIATIGRAARLTKRNAAVVRVTMTDGTSFRCTPEHRVLKNDGSYVRASDLVNGNELLQVGPVSSGARSTHGALGYAELRGEDRTADAACANASDVRFGELAHAMGFSSPISVANHATLLRGIEHVLMVGAGEEMGRVRAFPVVAGVANLFPRGNRSHVRFKREPMDEVEATTEAYLSVPARTHSARPVPAAIALDDTAFKNLYRGLRSRRSVALEPGVYVPVPANAGPVKPAHLLGQKLPRASGNRAGLHAKVIHSVEPCGNADVYDLTCRETNNFALAAGVFVHNCDPVENDKYQIEVAIAGETRSVTVSNFVYPAWFNEGIGQLDHMGNCTEVGDNRGYLIVQKEDGTTENVFASTATAEMRARVQAKLADERSRTYHRHARVDDRHRIQPGARVAGHWWT